MKWIITVLLTALLSFALCLFLPWWSIAIAAFAVSLCIPMKPWKSFLSGFLALLILWGGLSAWISGENNHLLAGKISVLILNDNNPFLLILMTACIGAVVGGFAALSGSLLRYSVHKS
ncbi:MAG: hypothetical protein KF880_10760 [Ferruginibacter sp.]|nr:hypothetical protein [Ferruginibacter sp.]